MSKINNNFVSLYSYYRHPNRERFTTHCETLWDERMAPYYGQRARCRTL